MFQICWDRNHYKITFTSKSIILDFELSFFFRVFALSHVIFCGNNNIFREPRTIYKNAFPIKKIRPFSRSGYVESPVNKTLRVLHV